MLENREEGIHLLLQDLLARFNFTEYFILIFLALNVDIMNCNQLFALSLASSLSPSLFTDSGRSLRNGIGALGRPRAI